MSKSRFIPDEKLFVNCINCRFYIKQLDLLRPTVKGICNNPYKYKGHERLKEFAHITWENDTSCGYSLPKNIEIDEKKYFKKDNVGYRRI